MSRNNSKDFVACFGIEELVAAYHKARDQAIENGMNPDAVNEIFLPLVNFLSTINNHSNQL